MLIQASPLTVTVLGQQKFVTVSGELLTESLYPNNFYSIKVKFGAKKSVNVKGELLTVLL